MNHRSYMEELVSDTTANNAFLGGQNPYSTFIAAADKINGEIITRYDSEINGYYEAWATNYAEGKAEAADHRRLPSTQFKAMVAAAGLDISSALTREVHEMRQTEQQAAAAAEGREARPPRPPETAQEQQPPGRNSSWRESTTTASSSFIPFFRRVRDSSRSIPMVYSVVTQPHRLRRDTTRRSSASSASRTLHGSRRSSASGSLSSTR